MTDYAFPTQQQTPAAKVKQRFVNMQYERCDDRSYHFEILLDHSWRLVDTEIGVPSENQPVKQIALFRRLGNPRAEIEIVAGLLPRVVHPSDWARCWLRARNWKIRKGREIATASGNVGDFLVSRGDENDEFVGRVMATKDGNRVFLVHGRSLAKDYDAIAEQLLLATKGFALLSPTEEKYVEPMQIQAWSLPIPGEFLAPNSWRRRDSDSPPYDGSEFALLNQQGGETLGQFSFVSLPPSEVAGPQKLHQIYINQLNQNGVAGPTKPLSQMNHPPSGLENAWISVHSAEKQKTSLEVRSAVLQAEGALCLFGMLGPAEKVSAECWMTNRRVMDIALDTFTLNPQ